jgi:hypothetical protein
VRRVVALIVAAGVLAAPATGMAAKGPAHPSKRNCKKHAKHLTKKQRKLCHRKRKPAHTPAPAPANTTPAGATPLSQPPAAVGPAPAAPTPTPTSTPTPLARLSVLTREYTLTLSRAQIASGDALIELDNSGEDPHDLRVEPVGAGSPPVDFPVAGSGTVTKQRLSLQPGTYKLLCTLGNHDALGMHATLTVGP